MNYLQLDWNPTKNEQLKRERGLCFEDVEFALTGDGFIDDQPHPNKERYPNQRLLIVLINDYPWCSSLYQRRQEVIPQNHLSEP